MSPNLRFAIDGIAGWTLVYWNKFNTNAVLWSSIRWAGCLIVWLFGLGLSASLAAQGPASDRLVALKARLAEQYPDVRQLSIEDYLQQYPDALLVDVRAAEEFAVSRIPGATHIEDPAQLLAYARQHSDRQLVLYCSVGARSSEAARLLQQQADQTPSQQIGEVANLAGSIFEWANEQRPLVNDSGPTREVHSYNAWWGWRYLDE